MEWYKGDGQLQCKKDSAGDYQIILASMNGEEGRCKEWERMIARGGEQGWREGNLIHTTTLQEWKGMTKDHYLFLVIILTFVFNFHTQRLLNISDKEKCFLLFNLSLLFELLGTITKTCQRWRTWRAVCRISLICWMTIRTLMTVSICSLVSTPLSL